MRDMTPPGAGAGLSPKLILTASGLELRYGSPESPGGAVRPPGRP